jgi:hypothetical protein
VGAGKWTGLSHSLSRFLYRLLHGAPFCTEARAVTPREWLLRRIPSNTQYYKRELAVPFQRVAFAPHESDTDGLSVFREMFVSPRYLALKTGAKPPYIVARIRACDFTPLKLSLQPSPDPDPREPRGHTVIPELTYARRRATKDLQADLSEKAILAYDPARKLNFNLQRHSRGSGKISVLAVLT